MTRRSTRSWCTPAPACSPGLPGCGRGPGVSAETPPAPARVPGDPADPARCHVEDGPAISVSTAQMLACTAALSWMTHGDAGAVLALGRRRRRPSSAIRRAARERDHCRCRFPGCESRRTDLHHIQHWVNGGRTDLDNLISLCPWHHKVVHDRGYLIAAPPGGGTFAFYRPDGTPAARLPAAARAGRQHRHRPRRRHHPGHDHPALVRRAPRPEPRHLGLLRQRQDQGRTRAGPRRPAPGPRHHLRTRRLRRTLPPVPRTRPPAYRPHPDPNPGVTKPARQVGGKGRSPLREPAYDRPGLSVLPRPDAAPTCPLYSIVDFAE